MSDLNSTERWHGLDAVRATALLLGVLLHASMSFLPGPQIWLVADASRSTTLSITFFVIHLMRMTVFFLIAGFFGRLVFHRVGAWGFLRNRLQRIAVPLLIAWPIVWTAIIWVVVAAAGEGGTRPPTPALSARNFPLAHLWFLYLLLLLYAGTLLIRGLLSWLDRQVPVRAAADSAVRGLMGPLAALALAIPVAVGLYRHPYWMMWFGIPTPDSSLYPNLAALLTYGIAFGLGWLVHRQAHTILPRWQRQWPWHLALALAATSACLLMAGVQPLLMPVPQGSRKLWFALCYAVALWSWTFALLGVGLRFLSGNSPVRRYLADASYWIYIVHLPLVMALQLLASRWPLPWQLKLPLILATALALLLLSYRYLVRPTFIGATLNGRRYPRGLKPRTEAAPVMRPLIVLLAIPGLLAAQSPPAPAPLPLETILARHATAVGPVGTVQTRRTTMHVIGMAPFEIPVVALAMRPNLFRKEVSIQKSIQVSGYDGADAWRIDPFVAGGDKPMDLPAAELPDLLEEADFDGPLITPAAKGHRIEYLGPQVVPVAGRQVPVHVLKVTLKGGRETVIHLDAGTWLEAKRVQTRPAMGRDTEMEIRLSDYRVVGGIRTPYLMEITLAGMQDPIRIVMDRIELNVAADRSRFSRTGAPGGARPF